MFCPGLSKNFPFSFYFFKVKLKLQKGSVFRKVKLLVKYCPAAIETAFSLKFVLDAKVRNSAFEIYHIYIFVATALP